MQERRNSIANALELRLSCTHPSKNRYTIVHLFRVQSTIYVLIHCSVVLNVVQFYYNTVNFFTNIQKRHPTVHPLGWGMGCLRSELWGVIGGSSIWLIFCLSPCNYLSYNIGTNYNGTQQYCVLLDHIIMSPDPCINIKMVFPCMGFPLYI